VKHANTDVASGSAVLEKMLFEDPHPLAQRFPETLTSKARGSVIALGPTAISRCATNWKLLRGERNDTQGFQIPMSVEAIRRLWRSKRLSKQSKAVSTMTGAFSLVVMYTDQARRGARSLRYPTHSRLRNSTMDTSLV